MSKLAELHELIASLDKQEKRYFRLQINTHFGKEGKQYSELFDWLEAEENFDEEKFLRRIRGKKWSRRLSVTSQYLNKAILRSLRHFHAGSMSEQQIWEKISEVKLLHRKGLMKQAKAQLARIRHEARSNNHLLASLEISWWQQRLTQPGENPEHRFFEEDQQIISQLDNISRYQQLQLQMKTRLAQFSRGSESKKLLDEWIASPLLNSDDAAKSVEAKKISYHLQSAVFSMTGKYDDMYAASRKRYRLFHDHDFLVERDPLDYISTVDLLLYGKALKKEFDDEYDLLLNNLQQMPQRSDYVHLRAVYTWCNMAIIGKLETGRYDEGVDFVRENKSFIDSIDERITYNSLIAIWYNIGCIYFGSGDYSSCIFWMNNIIREIPEQYRPDMHTFTRLVFLLAHFEKGNEELVDSLVRSLYRFLMKHNRLFALEDIVLRFFRSFSRKRNAQPLKQAFAELHRQLLELEKDPREGQVFRYFDFIAWLESHLTGKSFGEIVNAKIEKGKTGKT